MLYQTILKAQNRLINLRHGLFLDVVYIRSTYALQEVAGLNIMKMSE